MTPIDLTTNTPGSPIPVGFQPIAVAITPDGKTAYVTNDHIFNGTVTPIDVATNTPVPPSPLALDQSESRSLPLVAEFATYTVVVG